MKVPGVHHDSAGAGIVDQDADLVVVGLGLGEGVVQDDIDGVLHGLVGVQLGDDHPVPVGVQHLGHAEHDDVVVIDQRDRERRLTGWWGTRTLTVTALWGVPRPPLGVLESSALVNDD